MSHPADVIPEFKFPILENVRSYIEGTVHVREGTNAVASTPGEDNVHTVARLNDPTPFNGGVPALRVVGSGTKLFANPPPGGVMPEVDTGFSGDPLTTVAIQPVGTPQPWLYVADSQRQRKLATDGRIFDTGIAPPLLTPASKEAEPFFTIIDNFEYAAGVMPWLSVGETAGAPAQTDHVNTTIHAILHDATPPCNALVTLTDMKGIGRGTMLVFNDAESVLVQDVKIPIVPSTVAGILYDNGTGPGMCCIQPAGGLGTGQLQMPSKNFVQRTRTIHAFDERPITYEVPIEQLPPEMQPPAPTPIDPATAGLQAIRQLDFPVNCLVQVGDEPCRIESAAVGSDGLQSFRCRTGAVHTVGEALLGLAALRVWVGSYPVGTPVTTKGVVQALSAPEAPAPAEGEEEEEPEDLVAGMRSGFPYYVLLPNTPPGGGDPDDPDTDVPDDEWGSLRHKDVVERAKREVFEEGLVGPTFDMVCDSWQIVKRTAEILAGEGAGFQYKTGGNRCPIGGGTSGPGYSADRIMYPNGQIYDIVGGACSIDNPGKVENNSPMWKYNAPIDPDDYRPVGNNPIPSAMLRDVPSEAITEMNFAKIRTRMTAPEDELHLSIQVDKLAAVKEIRIFLDVDAALNDFTRNVYYYAFSNNDLIKAVQQFNAVTAVPVVDEVQTTSIPRDQSRGAYNDRYPWVNTAQDEMAQEAGNAPSVATTQLGLGNGQWLELRWRFKDMLHIGTDATRSLQDVKGIEILFQYDRSEGALQVKYDSFWIGGGFGPDVGEIGQPYTYTYRYRSSATGAVSNPAPPQRAGVLPRRQRVEVMATPSTDPQVDKIDWYRMGGALAGFRYLGTGPNTADPYFDDMADENVGTDPVVFDNYQPWPSQDVPRLGTCEVVGSSVKRLTGPSFDVRWAPGSQIKVNGLPYTLWAQPPSTTFLEIVESAGADADAPFELPNATIQGVPFPTLFGPFENHYFAVGDPMNPGQLNWTKGNDPDAASDKNTLYVCSPSTPLMNGFVWENAAFVASTEDIYRILPDYSQPNKVRFVTQVTPCGRGFWTRWCWCLTPYGVVFLAKDGIYISNAGSPAKSITEADLYPLFPHEGVAGQPHVRDVRTPDMTVFTALRLGYADGYVYFDYRSR